MVLSIVALMILPSVLLANGTVLQGEYSGRQVFTKGKGPFFVSGPVVFNADSDVLITPGTKFLVNPSSYIYFKGKVKILSNADNRVVFTSGAENPHHSNANTVLFWGVQDLELSFVQFDSIMRVYFYQCPNMHMSNNYFKNLGRAIYIVSCDGLFDSNRIWHTDDWHNNTQYPYGIYVSSESGKLAITNNEIINIQSGPDNVIHGVVDGVGIVGWYNHHLEIAHNSIRNVALSGIAVRNLDYPNLGTHTIKIHHNTVENVCHSISVYNDNGYPRDMSAPNEAVLITENTVIHTPYAPVQPWGNSRYGILVAQAKARIFGNIMSCADTADIYSRGIQVMGDSVLTIEKNKIYGYDLGFDINLSSNFYIWDDLVPSKYSIRHNTTEGCHTGVFIWSQPGIDLNPDDRVFTENNFINCSIPVHSGLINGEHLEDFSNNYWCGQTFEEIPEYLINNTLILCPIAPVPFDF